MDEASQGNIAMSLVPIIRGRSLMLVGDPQAVESGHFAASGR